MSDVLDENGWIKSIVLTKRQHDDLFRMLKNDGFSIKNINEDKYQVEALPEEDYWSWRFKRGVKNEHGKNPLIGLYRYMGSDGDTPNTSKRNMQCGVVDFGKN